MQHPDFRANGRIFATLHRDGVTGMVKLTPSQQQALVRAHGRDFAPSSGAWGRQGCTDVRLQDVDAEVLAAAIADAWQLAMSMPAPRSRRTAKSQPKPAAKAKPGAKAKRAAKPKTGTNREPEPAAKAKPKPRRKGGEG